MLFSDGTVITMLMYVNCRAHRNLKKGIVATSLNFNDSVINLTAEKQVSKFFHVLCVQPSSDLPLYSGSPCKMLNRVNNTYHDHLYRIDCRVIIATCICGSPR